MPNLLIQTDPGVERKRRLAKLLTERGMQNKEVSHWTQGLAKVLDSTMGSYLDYKADREDKENKKKSYAQLAQVMAGTGDIGQKFKDLSTVPGMDQDALAQMQLQALMNPQPPPKRDPVQDAKDIWDHKLENPMPKGESSVDKLVSLYASDLEQRRAEAEVRKKELEGDRIEAHLDQVQSKNEVHEYNTQHAADKINKLINHKGFGRIYGSFMGSAVVPTVMQSSADAEALRTNVIDILTLAARGQLTGQGDITRDENVMLKNAQSILSNPRISTEAALEEAKRVLTYLESKGANIDFDLGSSDKGKIQRPPVVDESEEDEIKRLRRKHVIPE